MLGHIRVEDSDRGKLYTSKVEGDCEVRKSGGRIHALAGHCAAGAVPRGRSAVAPSQPREQSATYASIVNATADGVTGVAASIQAALDKARDAGGGVVTLPAKALPYAVNTTLFIASNVHLFAYGATLKALAGCGFLIQNEGLINETITRN